MFGYFSNMDALNVCNSDVAGKFMGIAGKI